jgi:hypothetical protein
MLVKRDANLEMAFRLFSLAESYLVGHAVLWFGWFYYRRPFTRKELARGMALAFVGVFVVLQFAGASSYLKGPVSLVDG